MAASADPRRGPVQQVRPRYGRITAAGGAALVTLVAALGGLGVLPSGSAVAQPHVTPAAPASPSASPPASPLGGPSAASTDGVTPGRGVGTGLPSGDQKSPSAGTASTMPALPPDSGSGRRIVFGMSDQRVWLVDQVGSRDSVARTYLVSGSVADNLHPGTYAVYSKSLHAVGVEDSGTMQYMVRFARGQSAAIGFHDIPIFHGTLVQTRDELGAPRSHGCIRQWRPDAKALWRFAPVGTKVVVVV